MLRVFLLGWVMCFCVAESFASNGHWVRRNPDRLRFLAKRFEVTDSAVFLMGAQGMNVSRDGVTWTEVPFAPGQVLESIVETPDGFVGFGSDGFYRSRDGIQFWQVAPRLMGVWGTLFYVNGQLFMVGNNLHRISPDLRSSVALSVPEGQMTVSDHGVIFQNTLLLETTSAYDWVQNPKPYVPTPGVQFMGSGTLVFYGNTVVELGWVDVSVTTNLTDWEYIELFHAPLPRRVLGAAFGHNGLLVVGYDDPRPGPRTPTRAMFSPDLENWVTLLQPFPTNLVDAAYFKGKYLLASDAGLTSSSENGWAWTTPDKTQVSDLPMLTCGAYGGNRYVLMGSGGGYHSRDGVTWSRIDLKAKIVDVKYAKNRFFALDDMGGTYFSYEGSIWRQTEGSLGPVRRLTVTENGVGVIRYGGTIVETSNGLNWSTNVFREVIYSGAYIAYGNGTYVVIQSAEWRGSRDSKLFVSVDGTNWQGRVFVEDGEKVLSAGLAFGNGRFLLTGSKVMTSSNGWDWSVVNTDLYEELRFEDGYFIADANNPTRTRLSADGETWVPVPLPSVGSKIVRMNGRMFAVGAYGAIYEAQDWRSLAVKREGERLRLQETRLAGAPEKQLQSSTNFVDWVDHDADEVDTAAASAMYFRTVTR